MSDIPEEVYIGIDIASGQVRVRYVHESVEAERDRVRDALSEIRSYADTQAGDSDPIEWDPTDDEAREECAHEHPLLWICYLASCALNEGLGDD